MADFCHQNETLRHWFQLGKLSADPAEMERQIDEWLAHCPFFNYCPPRFFLVSDPKEIESRRVAMKQNLLAYAAEGRSQTSDDFFNYWIGRIDADIQDGMRYYACFDPYSDEDDIEADSFESWRAAKFVTNPANFSPILDQLADDDPISGPDSVFDWFAQQVRPRFCSQPDGDFLEATCRQTYVDFLRAWIRNEKPL